MTKFISIQLYSPQPTSLVIFQWQQHRKKKLMVNFHCWNLKKISKFCCIYPINAIIKPDTYAIKPGSRLVRVCISAWQLWNHGKRKIKNNADIVLTVKYLVSYENWIDYVSPIIKLFVIYPINQATANICYENLPCEHSTPSVSKSRLNVTQHASFPMKLFETLNKWAHSFEREKREQRKEYKIIIYLGHIIWVAQLPIGNTVVTMWVVVACCGTNGLDGGTPPTANYDAST